jgi:hypothetical protein
MSDDGGNPGPDEPAKKGRNARGHFVSGNKLSPGRKQGSRHGVTLLLEKLMEGSGEQIVQAVLLTAQNGDMTAARLVLERIVPLRKGAPVNLDLPPVRTATDLVAAHGAVIEAMAGGEVSPEEAAIVCGVLENKRKALELADIDVRLQAIEQAIKKNGV